MKKNVIILIHRLAGGGAERVASNLSLYLPRDKYNIYVVVYDDTVIDYPYQGHLVSLKTKSSSNLVGKSFNFIKRIYRLRKIKKDYQIDTTISLLGSANLLNILSRRKDKVIVSVRNFLLLSEGFYSNLNKLLMRILYNKADTIVAVSYVLNQELKSKYKLASKKMRVIYNPYDINKIKKLSKEYIEDKYVQLFERPTIVTVGSLTKQKGQWHLIRAFKLVKEKIPNLNLIIIGQGELEGYLKSLINDLDLNDDIHLLGYQKNPFKYITKSNLFVFPSLYEGFPNALCEAMACGIPVISTDCKSGPREILAPNTNTELTTSEIEYGEHGILIPLISGKYFYYIN